MKPGTDLDDEYFEQRAPEGVEGTVPYKGSVQPLVRKLLAGLRSAMSYLDASSIAELHENAEFIRAILAGQAPVPPRIAEQVAVLRLLATN